MKIIQHNHCVCNHAQDIENCPVHCWNTSINEEDDDEGNQRQEESLILIQLQKKTRVVLKLKIYVGIKSLQKKICNSVRDMKKNIIKNKKIKIMWISCVKI